MVSSTVTRPSGPQRPSASHPSSTPSSSRSPSPREASFQPPFIDASAQPSSQLPPSSQSTGSTQPESTQPAEKIIKRLIIVKSSGAVVGENQAKWKTRSGHFIRSHIPVRYHDWRKVPQPFKNDVWDALMGEFECNISQKLARPLLEREFSQRFRTAKNIYRTKILAGKTREEALRACPKGADPGHWEAFVANDYTSKMITKKAKNSANRKSNPIDHTNGRQSYAQVHHNEQLKNPHEKIGRAHIWKKGHEHADGTVLESARTKYDLVTAAQEKRKSIDLNGDGSNNHLDVNSDELFEVFGPDSGNHVRGVGSHIPKKHLQQVAVATEVLEQESSKSIGKVEADVSEVKSSVTTMQGVLAAILQQLTNIGAGSQSSPTMNTQTNDLGSNVARGPSSVMPPNLSQLFEAVNNSSSSPKVASSPQKVTLLDRKGATVAKGYIVTDATSGICHGRKVISGEKKVFVEEVFDPDAHIYDGPQNGEYTMDALSEGGFLIWLEGRLQLS